MVLRVSARRAVVRRAMASFVASRSPGAVPPGRLVSMSLFRLYLLRAVYLLIAVGLAFEVWPGILAHGPDWSIARGTMHALLGTVGLLSLLGLRYPLRMLPILFFELTWK